MNTNFLYNQHFAIMVSLTCSAGQVRLKVKDYLNIVSVKDHFTEKNHESHSITSKMNKKVLK